MLLFSVILIYDYGLTLSMEVDRYWLRPSWTLSLVLFYLNRYITLLGHIPIVLFFFLPPSRTKGAVSPNLRV